MVACSVSVFIDFLIKCAPHVHFAPLPSTAYVYDVHKVRHGVRSFICVTEWSIIVSGKEVVLKEFTLKNVTTVSLLSLLGKFMAISEGNLMSEF